MSDDSQIHVPAAFIALHVAPGRHPRAHEAADIARRHEVCEDLAQSLVERAQQVQFQLGITEADVLDKMLVSLQAVAEGGAADVLPNPQEAGWVVGRLAELLGWSDHLSDAVRALAGPH
ncbi:MAG: ATPase with chaperone activity [Hydrogenophaga sp.]|uniref:ATPase with chaperone activity n=1 Tax=Hydrogenophaga sp. TaxID=1904254 RepID=UPI001D41D84E|nr:ATPase with chaperone activity [Hydrogenophaga sp.]MBX3609011.1 ATPase with chaperone activity [Hydrogenophaga sp.]